MTDTRSYDALSAPEKQQRREILGALTAKRDKDVPRLRKAAGRALIVGSAAIAAALVGGTLSIAPLLIGGCFCAAALLGASATLDIIAGEKDVPIHLMDDIVTKKAAKTAANGGPSNRPFASWTASLTRAFRAANKNDAPQTTAPKAANSSRAAGPAA